MPSWMQPDTSGFYTVEIVTEPGSSTILADGADPEADPALGPGHLKLTEGSHEIRVTYEDLRESILSINVPDPAFARYYVCAENAAELRIGVDDPSVMADVFVNGEKMPSRAPGVFRDLPCGPANVRLVDDENRALERRVMLKSKKPTVIRGVSFQ